MQVSKDIKYHKPFYSSWMKLQIKNSRFEEEQFHFSATFFCFCALLKLLKFFELHFLDRSMAPFFNPTPMHYVGPLFVGCFLDFHARWLNRSDVVFWRGAPIDDGQARQKVVQRFQRDPWS